MVEPSFGFRVLAKTFIPNQGSTFQKTNLDRREFMINLDLGLLVSSTDQLIGILRYLRLKLHVVI
jgi:hypothetical protein